MEFNSLLKRLKQHSSTVIGGIIGALVGILILKYGFGVVLFVTITAVLGSFVGSVMKHSKKWLKRVIDKLLPPGTYR